MGRYRRQALAELNETAAATPARAADFARLRAAYNEQAAVKVESIADSEAQLGVWLKMISDVRELGGRGWKHQARSLAHWEGDAMARISPRRAVMYDL